MVKRCARLGAAAFTLVELMVATGVVVLLAAVLFALISHFTENVRTTRSTADELETAQRAFETLTRRVGQATLNSYWESYVVSGSIRRYERISELRFACGPMQAGASPLADLRAKQERMFPGHGICFQATTGQTGITRDPALTGLENLLNTWGYFVEAGRDELQAPAILPPQVAGRPIAPRLMELREPTQQLCLYRYTNGVANKYYAGFEWFRAPLADRALVRTVAENIAALIILPKLTAQETERLQPGATGEERDAFLAPHLFYHSATVPPPNTEPARNMRHRLPATVEITMVALNAATVARLYHPDDLDPLKLRDAFLDARTLHTELQLDPAQPALDSLERRLIAAHASYRLFTAAVPIRSAQ